jgi:hypothetical protein
MMTRFSIFIRDPGVTKPYVGVARVEVDAEDEAGARTKAVQTYDRVATGNFTDADVQFAAQIAVPDDIQAQGGAHETWQPTGRIRVL